MFDLVLEKKEQELPVIAYWQINQFYDKEEVEWVDKKTIRLHGINEGKMFSVVYDMTEEKEVVIKPPIPLSLEWHKLTNWRNAERIFKYNREDWENWKKQKEIPYYVVQRVEETLG